jgi:hypothetical protein
MHIGRCNIGKFINFAFDISNEILLFISFLRNGILYVIHEAKQAKKQQSNRFPSSLIGTMLITIFQTSFPFTTHSEFESNALWLL